MLRHPEAGQATLIVLAVGVLLLGIALALFLTTKAKLSTVTSQGTSLQARAVAEAGVVAAEVQIESCLTQRFGCTKTSFSGNGSLPNGQGNSFNYTATEAFPAWTINSTGVYGAARRQITASVVFSCSIGSCTYPPEVTSWTEK